MPDQTTAEPLLTSHFNNTQRACTQTRMPTHIHTFIFVKTFIGMLITQLLSLTQTPRTPTLTLNLTLTLV